MSGSPLANSASSSGVLCADLISLTTCIPALVISFLVDSILTLSVILHVTIGMTNFSDIDRRN